MATKKVTVTLPEGLILELGEWSHRSGEPVSKLVALAVQREVRRQAGLAAMAEWEAEHGAFTPAELAAARAEIASAEQELLSGMQRHDVA